MAIKMEQLRQIKLDHLAKFEVRHIAATDVCLYRQMYHFYKFSLEFYLATISEKLTLTRGLMF